MTDSEKKPVHRTIRSFVRRTGRMTPGQQNAVERLWPRFGLDFSNHAIDAPSLFGRTAPLVVEIGFGNGESLVEYASAHPEFNFLGIEVHSPGIGHCLLKAETANIDNLRVVRHDALEVLDEQVPNGGLQRINLYFPDPWPKARHHKRRIVQPDFLDLAFRKLSSGGTLNIATDWENYAEHIDDVMAACPGFEQHIRREHGGEQPLDRPQTKFERRGLKLGHHIWDWEFKRP